MSDENLLDPVQLAEARAERADGRISACYWFPRVEDAGLPVPPTVLVPYDHAALMSLYEDGEGNPAVLREVEDEAGLAARLIGFPVFVRTDVSSAKHAGPSAYRLDRPGRLRDVLRDTICDTEMKTWLTGPRAQAIMVREWLDLDALFTAFGGHPVAREWRLFTGPDGKVVCSHFYWPEGAIEGHTEAEGWREQLAVLREPLPPRDLTQWAQVAARVCDDHGTEWSVDFARTKDGAWYLIDMAPALVSYHDFPDGHER